MYLAAPPCDARPRAREQGLLEMYGQLVIKGFAGQTAGDPRVRTVRKALEQSLLGGVILYQKNILNPKQVRKNAKGKTFYIDHNTRTTHWKPPPPPTCSVTALQVRRP